MKWHNFGEIVEKWWVDSTVKHELLLIGVEKEESKIYRKVTEIKSNKGIVFGTPNCL